MVSGQGFQVTHEMLRSAAGQLPNQVSALGQIRGTVSVRVPGTAFANVTGSPGASAGHGANIDAMVQKLVLESDRLQGLIGGIGTTTAEFRSFDDEQARRLGEQNPDVVLAQADAGATQPGVTIVQRDGREFLHIQPSNRDWPAFEIPNTVGAKEGFRVTNDWLDSSHTYSVDTATSIPFDRGRDLVGQAYAENPTPGPDRPATPEGTLNDALDFMPLTPNGNVHSYVVPSTDPSRYTDMIVNYTRSDHILDPGYVLRRGVLAEDGTVTLQTWGEGDGFAQNWTFSPAWRPMNWGVWELNQGQIESTVLQRLGIK